MTLTVLKKSLGTDGQALTDESHGADALKSVLQACAKHSTTKLSAFQAAATVAVLDRLIVDERMLGDYLAYLRFNAGTAGTASATTVQLRQTAVGGSPTVRGTLTIDNADPDGTFVEARVLLTLVENDIIDIIESVAATGGANILVSCRLCPLEAE